jgi:hypothetical protein
VIAVEAAREQRGHFNIIHQQTGFKADFDLSGRDPLHTWGLARARHLEVEGQVLVVAPPEYVIVRKLAAFITLPAARLAAGSASMKQIHEL